jgi:hypothetical protein
MANKKITALTALGTTPATTDILPFVDDPGGATPITKAVTVANLMGAAPVQTVATRTGNVVLSTSDISGFSTRTWVNDSSTAYALSASDAGKIIEFSNGAAITVTVSSGLGAGFTCDLLQGGAGKVELSPASGITLFGGPTGTDTATEGQYCGVTLTMDSLGTTGYLTGQVGAATAAFTGLTLSNLTGTGAYFDDYYANVTNGMTPSWGSSAYILAGPSDLEGKYKKFEIADNAAMRTAVQSALGATGWMASSYGTGSLYAAANSYIENQTTGPTYVFAGASGATVTASTDSVYSIKYVPIIYGIDFNGSSMYGPVWGMTFAYNESGAVEETMDASGTYSYKPAAYVWGSSSSTTQTGFTADGGNGFVYPQSNASSMFSGDMA